MIIELIGTPGAGKTTLMPAISAFMNEKGFQAFSVIEAARPFAQKTLPGKAVKKIFPRKLQKPALWQIFYWYSYFDRKKFSERNSALMEFVFSHQEKRLISEEDREHVLRWFIHLTGYYDFFNKYSQPKEVLIYDEGFVHRVVQLFASENEVTDLEFVTEYLNLIPKPDLILFINSPTHICQERVFSRGVWERFRDKNPSDTKKFITNASEIVNFSVNQLRDNGWSLIEVKNDDQDISITQNSLRASLSEMIF